MRNRVSTLRRIIALLGWCMAPTLVRGEDRIHFDLACQGDMKDEREKLTPFTLRIRVDIAQKQFCIDELCNMLTRADKKTIEYHCHAGRTFCYQTWSTAGPFVLKDDFAIERSTGKFQRSFAGDEGDRAPRHFHTDYTGHCNLASFTGLGHDNH